MNFYEKIKDQVFELKSIYKYPNDGTAFGHFLIKECFKKIIDFEFDGSDFDYFINEHIVDGSNDLGNDAIFVNKINNTVMIFQFKYSKNKLLNISEIIKNKRFIHWLLKIDELELQPHQKLKTIIENEVMPIIESGAYNINFYYIDSEFDDQIRSDINSFFKNYRNRNIDFSVSLYDYSKLDDLYNDVEIPQNNVELTIVEDEYFIKKMDYYIDGKPISLNVLVTTIKANSLKKVVDTEMERIFELNVRYYKGNNLINKKIKAEYEKNMESNFWILNNGIIAICNDFNIKDNKLQISNLQIVNGCQTSKTLTKVISDIPDNVQLLMRLSKIVDVERISKIAKAIAIASNNQNAINNRDLHASDKIQQVIFDRLSEVGIFYDKKEGEWATLSNKAKKIYKNTDSKGFTKINNIDLGKAYLSFFLQIPVSSKGRDKLVFSEDYYDIIFNHESEDKQLNKLMFAYRNSELVNRVKEEEENKYEILQNNYINEIILSLLIFYYLKSNVINDIAQTIKNDKRIEKIKSYLERNDIPFEKYIDPANKYQLLYDNKIINYMKKVFQILSNILTIEKKVYKKTTDKEWTSRDTNNWLKKESTYFDSILEQFIEEIVRQSDLDS